ncbi:hypothetical protein [Piscirickettsia litoralis]|uniref:TauD/TfdA-like domain-containing protein n=1 Tax=Piscirickettsia litoralis TaxID=1891921 RepID=A0ABX3A417_9GAMM|nr:hypothetical protein [Piscirickettsia litoralis]ODN43607.1 hypothetical protein BGC07_12675 [Piscirickettsia litoralis]
MEFNKRIGLEIREFSLGDLEGTEIRSLLFEHKLLLLRNVDLTLVEFKNLMAGILPLAKAPLAIEGEPFVTRLSNRENA